MYLMTGMLNSFLLEIDNVIGDPTTCTHIPMVYFGKPIIFISNSST